MPKYIVIKAHDGIQEGSIKILPESPLTEYMCDNGYWAEEKPAEAKVEVKKKATRRK